MLRTTNSLLRTDTTMISKVEIRRKMVHLSTLSIPVGYALTSEKTALLILSLLFTGFLTVDLLRRYHPWIKSFFGKYFIGKVLRERERSTFMGSTYFLFSSLLTIFPFPNQFSQQPDRSSIPQRERRKPPVILPEVFHRPAD